MYLWQVLQFCFLLAVAIGAIALILAELKVVEWAEKAELEETWERFRNDIASLSK